MYHIYDNIMVNVINCPYIVVKIFKKSSGKSEIICPAIIVLIIVKTPYFTSLVSFLQTFLLSFFIFIIFYTNIKL